VKWKCGAWRLVLREGEPVHPGRLDQGSQLDALVHPGWIQGRACSELHLDQAHPSTRKNVSGNKGLSLVWGACS
jgi:hypothetical protein